MLGSYSRDPGRGQSKELATERIGRNDRNWPGNTSPNAHPHLRMPLHSPPLNHTMQVQFSILGGQGRKELRVMILPCPQPGGLPPGRVLHPGEEVGKGPASPPGSICGSHAIAEPAGLLLPLLRAVVHPGAASSASPAFRKQHHEKELQAWSWAGQAPRALKAKAITRPVRATQSLSLDCDLADHAEDRSQE